MMMMDDNSDDVDGNGDGEVNDPSGLLALRAVLLSTAMSEYLQGLSSRFAAEAPLSRDPGTVASTQ